MKYKIVVLSLFIVSLFLCSTRVLATTTDTVSLQNPITATSPVQIISSVIKALLGILGSVSLLMVVLGASKWLWSGGNPEKVESGTKTIIWAVLGVILTLTSYIILSVIIQYFQSPSP